MLQSFKKFFVIFVAIVAILFSIVGYAEQTGTVPDWKWQKLQEQLRFLRAEYITIETASNTEESLQEAPATMSVITAKEIKQRGYTELAEVLMDLPGFDVTVSNAGAYIRAYQRGYRTPVTSRTLFMLNGIVDNLLWSHEAAMSRQYPLSNIKRIEVLYGPASAVYGPNAFLGIINIITYDGSEVKEGEIDVTMNVLAGSYNSKGLDATLKGKPTPDFSFFITGQIFKSDEPDFTDKFGFLTQSQYSDPKIWGPILTMEHEGHSLGSYYDPTDDYGILANMQYKNLKVGLIHWKRKEGYGPYYAADRAQNNTFLGKDSNQIFLEYKKQINKSLKSHSLLLYHESRRYGYWAEAEPDWNEGMEDYSYVSFTKWNSDSNSWLFKQNFEFSLKDNVLLSGGLKFERKELTKAYDVPGYWTPAFASVGESGTGIGHSTDPYYIPPPTPSRDMPEENLAHTRDIGGYIQGIFDIKSFRFNLGLRYDKNSMYGSVINPRASAIYKYSQPLTFKLLYGEAFQEPAPMLLWGGWNGRRANPELNPEKARNLEFIAMHQMKNWFHEISLYRAYYSDVIKEEAENAGKRDIYGFEYRAKSSFPNVIPNSAHITSYFNYTFTKVTSSVHYNHDLGEWQDGDTKLGDIAPHKFNLGLNMPIGKQWNFNLRGNFVGERELYTRNPLRAQGEKLDSYFTLNGVIAYQYQPFDISFKVLNIFNKSYFHPGNETANSGNNFSQRSKGYINSLLPQPERSFWMILGINF